MNLKQITILAFSALIASAAFAGDYSDAVTKQNHCEIEGRMAAEIFTHDTIFGKKLEEQSAADARGDLPKDAFMGMYMIYLNAKSSRLANEKAAYMDAWGRCMDRK